MNASNVCSFVGRLPKPKDSNSDAFALTYEEKDESAGKNFSRFSATLSVRRNRKNRDEQYYKEDLIRFTAFGATADFLGHYAHKGDTLAITGELHVDTYENREGNQVTTTSILVDSANIIGGVQGNGNSVGERQEENPRTGTSARNSFHNTNSNNDAKPRANNPFRRSAFKGSEN